MLLVTAAGRRKRPIREKSWPCLLTSLVQQTTIGPDDIAIDPYPGAAIVMMAARPKPESEANGEVLADVVGWRARRDSNP